MTTPYGYCHCGCGERTKLAPYSWVGKGMVRGEPNRYVAGHHLRGRKGELSNATWKGGRHVTPQGYVTVAAADHPNAHDNGRFFEHRLVMERYLGRLLEPWETVHHINGDRTDNRIENLQLRIGSHGSGICYACADCGSDRVTPIKIKEEVA